MDPHASGQSITSMVARPVLDSLVHLDDQGGIKPWLAASWDVSADQKTYTFKLRDGVTFSDGAVLDAAAVKANIEHVVDPKTKSLGAAGYLAPYLKGVSAVDARTVRIELTKPYASLLTVLSTTGYGIESPRTLAGNPAELCQKIVGTGPFVLDGPWRRGQGATYHRNPAYAWAPEGAAHQGPALLDGLAIKLITQDSVRVGALSSGQADFITSVPAIRVASLRDTGRQVRTIDSPGENYSYYPNTTRAPFSDVRIRKAFRAAVDWKTLVDKLYFGVYRQAEGPLSPATRFVAPPAETSAPYDPAAAGRLLDEAGYTGRDSAGYRVKGGTRLTVVWKMAKTAESQENQTLGEQVQAELKKSGIELRIEDLPLSQVIPNAQNGTYDLLATTFTGLDADVLRKLFHSDSIARPGTMGSNIPKYDNAEVDQALLDAQATADESTRAGLYTRIQRRLVEDAVVFPVYVSAATFAADQKVRGVTYTAEGYPDFTGAWRSR
ncbi:ABC transporter substrate-binding protein [Actinocorallia aurantiaca]|uniref:ABC transporter substrate-binding protein n=1 Tax=Actinocorallia aurantiaca TaxID=46204 RepID=A0ABN3UAX3_9ACTN